MVRRSIDQDTIAAFWFRLTAFTRCMMVGSLFVDREFLEEVNLYEDIDRAFSEAGWSGFPDLGCDTNEDDTREFLASVVEDEEEGLRYRYRGEFYTASKQDFADCFGWTLPTATNMDDHTNIAAWRELSGDEHYVSGRCNASSIREPKFFYLHRLISQNILGRKPGYTKPNVQDMQILRGFLYEKIVPWCDLLWHHWTNLHTDSPIFVGGLITYYLQYMHGAEPLEDHTICPAEYLTKEKMRQLRAIRISKNGRITWRYRENVVDAVNEGEEDSQPLRRCTRARASARAAQGNAQAAHGGAQQDAQQGEESSYSNIWTSSSSGYPYAHIPYPSMSDAQGSSAHASAGAYHHAQQQPPPPLSISPEMNTQMFNLTRFMDYWTPPTDNMARLPPEDWRPGQPVPPGYQVQDDPPADDDGGDGQQGGGWGGWFG